jgi:hypothetical protein
MRYLASLRQAWLAIALRTRALLNVQRDKVVHAAEQAVAVLQSSKVG